MANPDLLPYTGAHSEVSDNKVEGWTAKPPLVFTIDEEDPSREWASKLLPGVKSKVKDVGLYITTASDEDYTDYRFKIGFVEPILKCIEQDQAGVITKRNLRSGSSTTQVITPGGSFDRGLVYNNRLLEIYVPGESTRQLVLNRYLKTDHPSSANEHYNERVRLSPDGLLVVEGIRKDIKAIYMEGNLRDLSHRNDGWGGPWAAIGMSIYEGGLARINTALPGINERMDTTQWVAPYHEPLLWHPNGTRIQYAGYEPRIDGSGTSIAIMYRIMNEGKTVYNTLSAPLEYPVVWGDIRREDPGGYIKDSWQKLLPYLSGRKPMLTLENRKEKPVVI